MQNLKTVNKQAEENREVKNEDALYKYLAFCGMLEKNRRENIKETRKSMEIAYGLHNFEEFYKDQLKKDANRDPRHIVPEHYQPKKIDQRKVGEGFRTTVEREADYFKEFELFKENKSKSLFSLYSLCIL